MAQEVQTTLNYKAELNLIEWVWYQQRRVSERMQVRDKWCSSWDWTSDSLYIHSWDWTSPTSWTINEEIWGVRYKVSWGDVIIPTWGRYMVEILPVQWLTQTNYYYTIEVLVNGESQFSKKIAYADSEKLTTVLNLGKKDKVTIRAKAQNVTTNWSIWLKLIQL